MNRECRVLESIQPLGKGNAECVYIAGTGRNGSTVLGMILSQSPSVFFAGELTHIWKRGFQQNQLCGCGQPFLQCEFWRAVAKDCFGADIDPSIVKAACLGERLSSFANLPKLLLGASHSKESQRQYLQIYRDLLASIVRVSGCPVIVDSSKYPTDLAALLQCDIPFQVVHLIRDCRAVVYSWGSRKRRPEIHWKDENMPRYGPMQTAIAWRTFNFLIEKLVSASGKPRQVLRYEDLVADPKSQSEQLFDWIGVERPIGQDQSNPLEHSVSGNPCRFNSGQLRVASDNRWRQGLSRSESMLVKLLCGSMQKHYGYGE